MTQYKLFEDSDTIKNTTEIVYSPLEIKKCNYSRKISVLIPSKISKQN